MCKALTQIRQWRDLTAGRLHFQDAMTLMFPSKPHAQLLNTGVSSKARIDHGIPKSFSEILLNACSKTLAYTTDTSLRVPVLSFQLSGRKMSCPLGVWVGFITKIALPTLGCTALPRQLSKRVLKTFYCQQAKQNTAEHSMLESS